MAMPNRKPGQTPPMLIVLLVAVIAIVLVIALGSGGGTATLDGRDSPQAIHSRAVQALNHNDPQALYAEMSPALKELFSLQEFISAEALAAGQSGAITQVEVLEPPALLTGPEWQGKWAQSTVRITRGAVSEIYLVRYVLEDGQWWLFGTLKQ